MKGESVERQGRNAGTAEQEDARRQRIERMENFRYSFSLRLSLQRDQCEVGTRRYSAPCMLQESPSLPIVLMCLVERQISGNGRAFGRTLDGICARGGGNRWERDGRFAILREGGDSTRGEKRNRLECARLRKRWKIRDLVGRWMGMWKRDKARH